MNKQEIEKSIAYWKEFKAEIPELMQDNPDFEPDLAEQEKRVDLAISALEHQLTNGWIPVLDHLPTQEDIEKNGSDWFMTTVHKDNGYVDLERFRPLRFDTNNNQVYGFSMKTVAWKYLPEPYKEEL